jgi:hypothetical protein
MTQSRDGQTAVQWCDLPSRTSVKMSVVDKLPCQDQEAFLNGTDISIFKRKNLNRWLVVDGAETEKGLSAKAMNRNATGKWTHCSRWPRTFLLVDQV